MALAVDASSPAAVVGATATTTTASFSPPANSLLVAYVMADANSGVATEQATVTSTGGLSWTFKARHNGSPGADVEVWYAQANSAPGSMTVSVTDNQGAVDKRLFVQVYTDAGNGTPAGVGATSSGANISLSYTSTVANSWGWAVGLAGGVTPIAGSGQTVKDFDTAFDGGDGTWVIAQNATTATPGSTVTMNVTTPTSAVHHLAAEILPAAAAVAQPARLLVTSTAWSPPPTRPVLTASRPLGNPAVPTPVTAALKVVSPPFAWPYIPPVAVTSSKPLGNPAVGTGGPLVVTPTYTVPPVPPARLWAVSAPAAAVAAAATPNVLVVSPAPSVVPVPGARVFTPTAVALTPAPLVVTPPYVPVPVLPVTITASQPLGNPAVGTSAPIVVSAPWAAKVPGALISSNPAVPAAPATTSTPQPLVVSPPGSPVVVPVVYLTASQPLGNPAAPTPQPLVVTTTWTAEVPGALISSNPPPPPGPSTTSTPQPLVVGPPRPPVPIPVTYLAASQPLGNPAVGTPQPLVVSTAWVSKVPGALLSANRLVPPTSTPPPMVVTPPFVAVPVPKNFITASLPLGRPAAGSPQPMVVSPPHRWTATTAPALSVPVFVCECITHRPATGTTARPTTGTTVYNTATTARPGSGTTARPDTGITKDPCC